MHKHDSILNFDSLGHPELKKIQNGGGGGGGLRFSFWAPKLPYLSVRNRSLSLSKDIVIDIDN